MGIDPFTAMVTPFQIVLNDLEMIGMENEYGNKKPEEDKKAKKVR